MSNGDAANHWRAIEEEKLRKRIAELESWGEMLAGTLKGLEAEVAEQARLLDMSATREAKLVAEVARLRAQIEKWKLARWQDAGCPIGCGEK